MSVRSRGLVVALVHVILRASGCSALSPGSRLAAAAATRCDGDNRLTGIRMATPWEQGSLTGATRDRHRRTTAAPARRRGARRDRGRGGRGSSASGRPASRAPEPLHRAGDRPFVHLPRDIPRSADTGSTSGNPRKATRMKSNMKFRALRLAFAVSSLLIVVEALGAARRF